MKYDRKGGHTKENIKVDVDLKFNNIEETTDPDSTISYPHNQENFIKIESIQNDKPIKLQTYRYPGTKPIKGILYYMYIVL